MFFRFQKNFLNNFKFSFAETKNKFLVYDQNLYICPWMVGCVLKVYTGNFFFFFPVKENMIGFKIKDFIFTKKRAIFKSSKVKKKSK